MHRYIRRKNNTIDYTSNLVILEEDYENLLHPIVLNQITYKEYILDREPFVISLPISVKFYCLLEKSFKIVIPFWEEKIGKFLIMLNKKY